MMNAPEDRDSIVPFAYRDTGHGDPMVLVHGNLSDLRSWQALEPLVAQRFRVVSYSRRFAWPNPPADDSERDSFLRHVDDLAMMIDTLRLGPVHLVGNSSGAFVCLLLAQQRPDLVRTLVLEEPPVVSLFLKALPPGLGDALKLLLSSPLALAAIMKLGVRSIAPAIEAFKKGDDGAAIRHFGRGVLGEASFAALLPERRQQLTDNVKAHRASMLGAGLPVFTASEARTIEVPTLLLRGGETPAFQRLINQRLAKLIPGAREACIPGASHFAHEDCPSAVAQEILDFCTADFTGRGI